MESREIENADGARPLSAAVRSLTAWFEGEVSIVNGAIGIAREQLAAHPGDAETRASLGDLEQQRVDLYAGWKRSSIRRAVGNASGGRPSASAAERRVGLAGSGGSTLATGARATGTASSTMTAKSIDGYGAVFGREAIIGGVFRERLEAGAFADALKTSDIRCLFNHDSNYLLGRSSAATLEVKEDSRGLFFRAYLLPFDAVSYGIARRVERRDLQGCSFSFSDVTDRWVLPRKPGDLDLRIIEKVGLVYDLGPVCFPAYEHTTITATFQEVPRSAAPAEYDSSDEPPAEPRARTISLARQRRLEADLTQIEGQLRADRERIGRIRRLGLTKAIREKALTW